jgi:hypothetical protein
LFFACQFALSEEPIDRATEAGLKIGKLVPIESGAKDDDEIQTLRIAGTVPTKNFAYETFAAVPLDRVTDPATGNNAQTCGRIFVRLTMQVHNKRPALETLPKAADLLKVSIRAQTL